MYEMNLCPARNKACCPHLQMESEHSYTIVDKEKGKEIKLWKGDI